MRKLTLKKHFQYWRVRTIFPPLHLWKRQKNKSLLMKNKHQLVKQKFRFYPIDSQGHLLHSCHDFVMDEFEKLEKEVPKKKIRKGQHSNLTHVEKKALKNLKNNKDSSKRHKQRGRGNSRRLHRLPKTST